MDLLQAVTERHSVRQYLARPLEADKIAALQTAIDEENRNCGLHFQLVVNEPEAFDGWMARYGKFSGVQNYVALAADKDEEEKIGYSGAKIVLLAQTLGLNTCWVAMTFKKIKTAFVVNKGEKLYGVLALGYGKTQGVAHKSKSAEEVSGSQLADVPAWFTGGVKAALLAPTAMNRQKFRFTLEADGCVSATTKGGFYTKTDLGIARYFFEVGANGVAVKWKK